MADFRFFIKPMIQGKKGMGEIIFGAMNLLTGPDWFGKVVKHPSCKFKSVSGYLYPSAGVVQNHELLVYIVPGPTKMEGSVVALKGGGPGSLTHGGRTLIGRADGVICEVYWASLGQDLSTDVTALDLCGRIFHEFMHCKIDIDPQKDLHRDGGGAIAGPNPLRSTKPNDTNIALMAARLAKEVPQFTAFLPNERQVWESGM
ncbi:MAG: hypothetical protein JSS81_03930 [Acidobacteria bacterium]|nr:hypothetical protein [Acidobacteriota bacterium]